MTEDATLFPELPAALKVTHWRPRWSVDAVRLDAESDWGAIAEWCEGELGEQGSMSPPYSLVPAIRVFTEWGIVWATEGNWIVKQARLPKVYEATAFADMFEQAAE